MSIWTVYDHPLDFPHGFIARRWEIRRGAGEPAWTEDVMRAYELEPLQEQLMDMGLSRLGRNEGDEPQIVECWL